MNEFDYVITKDVYEWIKNGTKRIEIRLYNEKSSKININDIINFKVLNEENIKLKVRVVALLIYKTINELFDDIDNSLIMNKNIPKDELEKN